MCTGVMILRIDALRKGVVCIPWLGQVLYWELHPDLMEGEISKQDKIVNLLPLVALATLVVCGIAIRFM